MKKKSIREQVAEGVLFSVLTGEYDVNSTITEKMLIDRFGVSKSPVRDALVSLCSMGVLESIPRYGYRPVRYEKSFFDGIQRFRQMIEPQYLHLLWDNITHEDIAHLEKVNEEFLEDAERCSPLRYWKHNQELHLAIASALHDEFYEKALQEALNKQRLVFIQHYGREWEAHIFDDYTGLHIDIIRAIREGDRETAVQKLAEDISTFICFS